MPTIAAISAMLKPPIRSNFAAVFKRKVIIYCVGVMLYCLLKRVLKYFSLMQQSSANFAVFKLSAKCSVIYWAASSTLTEELLVEFGVLGNTMMERIS